MNLRFAFTTQDLSLLAAGSRGQVKASGTLGGTLREPVLRRRRARLPTSTTPGSSSRGSTRAIDFDPAVPRQGVEDRGTPAGTQLPDAHPGGGDAEPQRAAECLRGAFHRERARDRRQGAGERGLRARHLRRTAHRARAERQRRAASHPRSPGGTDCRARSRAPRVAVPGGYSGQRVRGRRMEERRLVDDRHDQRAATRHAHRRHDALGAVPRHHRRAGAPQRRRRHPAAGQRAGLAGGRGDRAPARQQADRAHPHRLRHGRREPHADGDHRPGDSGRRPGGHPAGQGCRAAHRAGVAEHAGDGRAARPERRARPGLPVRPCHRSRRRALQRGRRRSPAPSARRNFRASSR